MSHPVTDIRSMTPDELTAYMEDLGEKKYRARQLYEWIHVKCALNAQEMTSLSAALRRKLSEQTNVDVPKALQVLRSSLDGTEKYLCALSDGNVVESVLMRYHHGNSVCISSQVGCRMGCAFCASTIGGRIRDLTAGEMLGQVYLIRRMTGERVSHVVVMGSGEPLDNYEQLVRFIRMLTDENGQNISQRNVTVSTCGLVPRIEQLKEEKLAVTLALSLHASSQEKREKLMPIAKKYPLEEVMEACLHYQQATGRRMTFEYSLVKGVNDTLEDARELAALVSETNGHVNLIPVNPVDERSFRAPDRKAVEAFKQKLENLGINVTIRREMGRDINGACGQLRRSYIREKALSEVDE